MLWLIVTIVSYLVLSFVYLIDKYLLAGPIPSPKVYAFYVGALGVFVLIFAPFTGFYLPEAKQISLSLITGAIFVFSLFWWFRAIRLYEVSRVVSATGGLIPIFTFFLIFIFSSGKTAFHPLEFMAFVLLVLGSIIIARETGDKISFKSFQASAIAAFLFALTFALSKFVYMTQPFWSGYIWIRIGGFFMAMVFFLFWGVRNELLKTGIKLPKKTFGILIFNQAGGAGANILQNWAVALAPLAYVAIINALQGVQYVFLFIFTILLSWKFPKILKEEVTRKAISQKVIAILLICGGLAILAIQ